MPDPMVIWTPAPPFGPLWTFGSGKFGTPFERMHSPYLSAFAFSWVIPPEISFGFGMYFWQIFVADSKAGALTGTPLTVIVARSRCAWTCTWRPPPLPALGSGKFGTPWERMQPANSSPALLTDAEDGSLEGALLLPQPATSSVAASAGIVA